MQEIWTVKTIKKSKEFTRLMNAEVMIIPDVPDEEWPEVDQAAKTSKWRTAKGVKGTRSKEEGTGEEGVGGFKTKVGKRKWRRMRKEEFVNKKLMEDGSDEKKKMERSGEGGKEERDEQIL